MVDIKDITNYNSISEIPSPKVKKRKYSDMNIPF